MTYNKTGWKDRVVEKPNTFNARENQDGTVTLIPKPGQILQSGTPVNADNLNKIEDGIANTMTQLAETDLLLEDLNLFVRDFKTDENTWNEALQEAVVEGNVLYETQSELGGLYIPRNVVIKMPRGRFIITETIKCEQGLDFDFTNSVFVASPADKTLDFMNMAGKIFRNEYIKGAFVGFEKVLPMSSNNRDTSFFKWEHPTFQNCHIGVDTISYEMSRSTVMKIENIYSIKTDQPIRTYTDMTVINGGWIYHTGWDGAAIYNHSFLEMNNVILVPSSRQESQYEPRWIDNYSRTGVGTGSRGVRLNHNRFSGETGSMPTIYNYAKYTTAGAETRSVIEINHSQLHSASHTPAIIKLFEMPNYIKMTNVNGLINLTDGLISIDPSLDVDSVPQSRYISIELDRTTNHRYKLMDERLMRFLYRNDNNRDMFRNSFRSGFYKPVKTTNNEFKFPFKINVPVSSNLVGWSFMLNLVSSGGGALHYTGVENYIVQIVGGNSSGSNVYRLIVTPLAVESVGPEFGRDPYLESVIWENESIDLPISNTVDINTNIKIKVTRDSVLTLIPLSGTEGAE